MTMLTTKTGIICELFATVREAFVAKAAYEANGFKVRVYFVNENFDDQMTAIEATPGFLN
jgi:hypothetical protein